MIVKVATAVPAMVSVLSLLFVLNSHPNLHPGPDLGHARARSRWQSRRCQIDIDQRVLGFALIITLGSSLLFALAPAWRTTSLDMHDALRAGRGSTGSRRRQRVGRSLVVA